MADVRALPSAEFDPYDRSSWYYGKISREDTNRLLAAECDGAFLVRDSTSFTGEYVLSVRESGRDSNVNVSHYKITPFSAESGEVKYQIGDTSFPDLPSLLNFYKLHFLDKTTLIKPLPRQLEKFIALYDFTTQAASGDLPFKKGDTLYIIKKGEDETDEWWTAKDAYGQEGQIPSNYLAEYNEETAKELLSPRNSGGQPSTSTGHPGVHSAAHKLSCNAFQRKLPAMARAKQSRVPNAYDKTALRLEVGDIIKVTKLDPSGTCEGELRGKTGHFPFTYIEWLDDYTVGGSKSLSSPTKPYAGGNENANIIIASFPTNTPPPRSLSSLENANLPSRVGNISSTQVSPPGRKSDPTGGVGSATERHDGQGTVVSQVDVIENGIAQLSRNS